MAELIIDWCVELFMGSSKLYFSSLLLLLPLHCFGAAVDSTIGRVVASGSAVEAMDASGNTRQLTRGDVIFSGDRIRTVSNGTAQFRMTDGSLLLLKGESEFEFVLYEHDGPGGTRQDRVLSSLWEYPCFWYFMTPGGDVPDVL